MKDVFVSSPPFMGPTFVIHLNTFVSMTFYFRNMKAEHKLYNEKLRGKVCSQFSSLPLARQNLISQN